jgi:hypothetical protein
VGSEACAGCHASIYQSYERTTMARASGPAIENVISADFVHPNSGVHYRIYSEANHVSLNFERPDDPEVRGKRELLYYIGSGRRGLSYLFARDGFLFESQLFALPRQRHAAAGQRDRQPLPEGRVPGGRRQLRALSWPGRGAHHRCGSHGGRRHDRESLPALAGAA